jgi:hypothetical protein
VAAPSIFPKAKNPLTFYYALGMMSQVFCSLYSIIIQSDIDILSILKKLIPTLVENIKFNAENPKSVKFAFFLKIRRKC